MTDAPSRVVSLAPSATATLQALGATDSLVGATHHDDADVPAVGGWLNPDFDRLADVDPDLVLTADALQADVRDDLVERGYAVHHADPRTLDDVVESFAALGRALGRPTAGQALAADARDRIETIRARVPDDGPTVYCEEWHDPPMAAGNWVPDVVRAAGGRYPFLDPGERSREVDRATVEAAAPEYVFVHVCGHGDRIDPGVVADRGWDLPAVLDRVHVVDDSLLNQPSPRLLDGLERVARTLHPAAVETQS